MKKEKGKKAFYAIRKGKDAPCICTSWMQARKRVYKTPSPIFKKFDNLESAIKFLKTNKFLFIDKEIAPKKEGVSKCFICDKPLSKKGIYCYACLNKCKTLKKVINEKYHIDCDISKRKIAVFRRIKNIDSIFEYLFKKPNQVFMLSKIFPKDELDKISRKFKDERKIIRKVDMNNIPFYIREYFIENESVQLVDIKGDEKDVLLTVKCLKCGIQKECSYLSIVNGFYHNCEYHKSSGEYLVKKYLLEKKVEFKEQRETLKCINPVTNSVLPYDFELPKQRVIIEVQGQQHYCQIEHFHSSKEGFEYQKFKDKTKKEFAINLGYKFIEIDYNQIKSGEYKQILSKLIN